MFKQIFSFELKLWLKKPATYIFFLVFFGLSMFITSALAGLLGGASETNATINSAKAIAEVLNALNSDLMGIISLVILITIIAPAVYKDFQYNMHPLLFTNPISKFGYMFGRFSAAFLIAMFVVSATVFGHMITCAAFGVDAERLGPFNIMNYVQPFLIFVVPNTLLVGAIFFSLVTFSRNMISGYVGAIILLVLKGVSPILLRDLDNQNLAALLDPFGDEALSHVTKYWSAEEQNTLGLPMGGILLYNRLLWLGISLLLTGFTFYRFEFAQFNNPVSFSWFKKKQEIKSIPSAPLLSLSDLPKVDQTYSFSFTLKQIWFLAKFEYVKVTKTIFFLIIALLSILILTVVSDVSAEIYGTPTLLVTYQILQVSNAVMVLFAPLLIVFYSGVVVWREKDSKTDELIGASPIASSTSFLSKLLGLIMMQGTLLLIIMLTGIIIQLADHYYKVELLLYVKDLFGFKLIGLALLCTLSMALQVFFNQKFVGYTISALLIMVLPVVAGIMAWKSGLYIFNSTGPRMPYSDMNGYGHQIFTFFIFKSYWVSFSVILIILSNLLWIRGKEKGFKARLRVAKSAFNGKAKLAMTLSVLAFLGFGSFIYYNTSVLNKNLSDKETQKLSAEFEKKYKRLSNTPQPRIIGANWNVDIFPEERGVKMSGYYWIKNKTNKAIDSMLVNLYPEVNVSTFEFAPAFGANVILDDKDAGFRIYKLSKKFMPGDSMKVNIVLDHFPKGFKFGDAGTSIVANGTFFNSMFLPSFGYPEGAELSDNEDRKKNGLPKKERMADVNDSTALKNNYISSDSDWIDFECTMSTSKDQIALAPGYLIKEWEEGGRKYYHYKMDCKILNFYSFLSARYEVKKDKWIPPAGSMNKEPVAIEIYYNKGHEYNLDRMINGIKKSLDYYTVEFSPYQHRQVRILEFSLIHGTFAQSFPNTIPFSEGIGFIAKVDTADPESVDYPFYVTAHEVAHQWWAHQVIGGNVRGATVMSETMSQYSALMVMEKEFGKPAMKKFLKYETQSYLKGRALEAKKEKPLMYCENQQYIHYNKGSVVMYALRDYIGEDSLNAALAKYIKKVGYQEPPYTNSVEFVNFIKAATPDSLKYIINDLFETITLYENKTTKCSYTKTPDGKYLVKFSVDCKKQKADSVGKMKEVAIGDWIDVGVFGSKEVNGKKTDTELYLKKHKISKNKMDFEVIVNEEPEKVGIDPYNKLIDRTPDNNTRTFKDTSPVGAGGDEAVTVTIGG